MAVLAHQHDLARFGQAQDCRPTRSVHHVEFVDLVAARELDAVLADLDPTATQDYFGREHLPGSERGAHGPPYSAGTASSWFQLHWIPAWRCREKWLPTA